MNSFPHLRAFTIFAKKYYFRIEIKTLPMRKYLCFENGFTEKPEWQPGCWVNVECPDNDDFTFLMLRSL